MIIRSCRAAAFAALACTCVLAAGCDDAPPESSPTAPAAGTAASGPKPASLSNEMVSAVSAGKNASAIGVHFALRAPPTVGMPLPVAIVIVPHRKFLTVRAHFETHDGLTMTAGDVYGPSNDVAAESVLKHELTLLPEKEGVFMVTTIVDTEGEEGSVTRVFSIPVIVGPAGAAATPKTAPPAPAAG
jgi:hypothetical protein